VFENQRSIVSVRYPPLHYGRHVFRLKIDAYGPLKSAAILFYFHRNVPYHTERNTYLICKPLKNCHLFRLFFEKAQLEAYQKLIILEILRRVHWHRKTIIIIISGDR
jgi:hypothetical protein